MKRKKKQRQPFGYRHLFEKKKQEFFEFELTKKNDPAQNRLYFIIM